jgi:hypothetical protein
MILGDSAFPTFESLPSDFRRIPLGARRHPALSLTLENCNASLILLRETQTRAKIGDVNDCAFLNQKPSKMGN